MRNENYYALLAFHFSANLTNQNMKSNISSFWTNITGKKVEAVNDFQASLMKPSIAKTWDLSNLGTLTEVFKSGYYGSGIHCPWIIINAEGSCSAWYTGNAEVIYLLNYLDLS